MEDTEIISGLLKYLEQKYKLSGLVCTKWKKITEGWETDIFIISIKPDSDEISLKIPQTFVLRMYSGEDASQNAIAEFNTIKKLFEINYSVPEVYFVEESKNFIGKPFIIMKEIKGDILGTFLYEGTEQDKQHYYDLFAQIYVDLHTLDWTQLVSNPESYSKSPNQLFEKELEETVQFIRKNWNEELDKVNLWILSNLPTVKCNQLAVIHGDFHPANVIINEKGLPIVIDWHYFQILDFRVDLARTLVLTQSHGSDELRDEILSGYEQFKGSKIPNLAFFEVFAIFERLVGITAAIHQDDNSSTIKDDQKEKVKTMQKPFQILFQMLYERTQIELPAIEKIMLG